jgi:hypothetical protein
MHLSRAHKRQIERDSLWAILHHGQGRAGRVYHILLIALILFSSALVAIEFVTESGDTIRTIQIMEAVVVALFTVEYGARLYAAPNRMGYALSWYGIIDLLSIIPFYAGIWGSPLVRLVSLIRLFKLGEIEGAARFTDRADMKKDIGLVEGEKVEYVVGKSPFALIIGVITPLVALIFGLGTLLLGEGTAAVAFGIALLVFSWIFLWKTWLDYSYDVIYVTNYRLIFQNQHILGRSINQVTYNSVTNVKPYYPNPISFILRYGSLIIDTAAERPGQIQLNMVRKHEQAAHVIMQKTFLAQHKDGPGPVVKDVPEAA